jgi:glucose/arabinose dehydrogenase
MTTKHLAPLLCAPLLFLLAGCGGEAPDTESAYVVETIETPPGLVPEVGGIDFMPDGRLVAVFHRGEVMTYDPDTEAWDVFAHGLHDPLGVKALSNHEVLVTQRPELTRLRDTNQDGRAERYETVTDDFGMSGNYHEFAFGPAEGPDGNLYISLNTASKFADVWDIMRGTFNPEGRPGRMYAAVPYRGWVMRYNPETDSLSPFASGFRSPNGLVFDPEGRLLVTDNQGDWLGTSKLYHVQRGAFYGHPQSLVWEEGMGDIQPLDLPVPVLNTMRTRASILFPQGLLANSPTQPVVDRTGGQFGPFEHQLLIGEMNHARIMRVMLETVDGAVQGAVTTLIDTTTAHEAQPLRIGNNRLAFAPDGSLWVGQTDHGWPGDEGLQRIRWTGQTPMAVSAMHLTDTGFELTFTKPLHETTASADSAYQFTRYYYEYHQAYGSDQMDVQPVDVTNAEVSDDGRRVSLTLDDLAPGYVYQLDLSGLQTDDGTELALPPLYYTLNRLQP